MLPRSVHLVRGRETGRIFLPSAHGGACERILVRGGKFLFGAESENRELPGFLVGATPASDAEYEAFVAETGREPPRHWSSAAPAAGTANHPVVFVSWFDARAFVERVGGRLLAEEEWERATPGAGGRTFSWGEWAEGRCNSVEAGIGGTTPLGQFSPSGNSPCGCADTAGNAQE